MGFFTSTSKFIVHLFTAIFSLAGLFLLGVGLWMRFDQSQWATMQAAHNGETAVYTYIGLGAALLVFAVLGNRGASRPNRRFTLFLFQLGTLACLIVSVYGAVVLFKVVSDNDTASIGDKSINIGDVNKDITSHLTQSQIDDLQKYQRPFAIFLACIAGAQGLMLIASFILCFQKREVYLPSYNQRQINQPAAHQAWTCTNCQKRNTTPDQICGACFTQN